MEARRFSATTGDSMYAQSVLIADPNPTVWQELSQTLSRWPPQKLFGFCTSRDEALDRVDHPGFRYDVVISTDAFAESENCFLLNGLKCLSVPLIITGGVTTLTSTRRVLDGGAFGLIRLPVDGKRASQTLLWATELKEILRRATVYRDMLEDYHERLESCPQDVQLQEVLLRSHVVFESTYDRWKETIVHIEQSVKRLDRAAAVLEDEARVQAYLQLYELEATKKMS
jgi:hypothetical protein